MVATPSQLNPYLAEIRALDFVTTLAFSSDPRTKVEGVDGILQIGTPTGRFPLTVQFKSSYLGRTHINALISQAKEYVEEHRPALLLLARYLPAPSATKLAAAGINFLDRAGNIHLTLGINYSKTIIGQREPQKAEEPGLITAAKGRLLFTFAAYEQAPFWTVRKLAEESGVSKSNVAKLRKQLVREGILTRTLRLRDRQRVESQLLSAYEQALRPKLFMNRFRAAESSTQELLEKVRTIFRKSSLKWSLTGGPAAFALQHFYKGPEMPVFVESFPKAILRELRVLPDENGPLIFLKSFGTMPFWKEVGGITIAHPWLIYSELMYSSDPRAHEAAGQLKSEFLE